MIRHLLGSDPAMVRSVSATTRPKRADERDGVDYHFLTEAAFRQLAAEGGFVQWVETPYGLYGTPFRSLEAAGAERTVLMDLDPTGAAQVKAVYPEAVSLFLLPPSIAELKARLAHRGAERGIHSEADLQARLESVYRYIAAAPAYDYLLVCAEDRACAAQAAQILAAERLRRQKALLYEDWCRRELGGAALQGGQRP